MINETDPTPTDPTEIETADSYQPHPRPVPEPDIISKAIAQYNRTGVEISDEEFARLKNMSETKIYYEDCEKPEANRVLLEQSALFDIAFSYYYSGGESGVINDDAFRLALKAQRQSLKIIEFFRTFRRNKRKDEFQREKYQDEMARKDDRPFHY